MTPEQKAIQGIALVVNYLADAYILELEANTTTVSGYTRYQKIKEISNRLAEMRYRVDQLATDLQSPDATE